MNERITENELEDEVLKTLKKCDSDIDDLILMLESDVEG